VCRSGSVPVLVFLHHGVDDPGGGVFIGPAAVYVSECFATLGVTVCRERARLRPSGQGQLAALPHGGGDAELRTRLPPHGLAVAPPGRRPEMLSARRLRCELVIGSSLSVVAGSDFCGLLAGL
jgi:hypothetical protein